LTGKHAHSPIAAHKKTPEMPGFAAECDLLQTAEVERAELLSNMSLNAG